MLNLEISVMKRMRMTIKAAILCRKTRKYLILNVGKHKILVQGVA